MYEFAREPVALPGVTVVQATWELPGIRHEAMMPPGLWPTSPLLMSVLAFDVADGPLGAFRAVLVRLSCRSGARARAFVVGGALDAPRATVDSLHRGWGFPDRNAGIEIERRYAATTVVVNGVLEVELRDPMPLGLGDVHYVVGLHPVAADGGERLLQVEVDVEHDRLERGRAVLRRFDAGALGDGRLRPTHPVAATVGTGTLTLPKARFVIDPRVEPRLGTTVVGRADYTK